MIALLGRYGLVLLSLLTATSLQAASLTVTTMNVEFYGLNNDNAQRDPAINEYLDENDLRSDVMVFQEIVDVERLKEKIVGPDYTCISYESRAHGHQHVVVCHRPTVQFERAE